MGTLKSTRIKTLLPFRSKSLTVSLVIIRREGIQRIQGIQGIQRIQGILGISSESFSRLLPHQFNAVRPFIPRIPCIPLFSCSLLYYSFSPLCTESDLV